MWTWIISTLLAVRIFVDVAIDGIDAARDYGDDGEMAGDALAVSHARTRHGHIHGTLVMDWKERFIYFSMF